MNTTLENFTKVKLIPQLPGYAATPCGCILSIPRQIANHAKGKKILQYRSQLVALNANPNAPNGQWKVDVCLDGKRKTVYVKNIVAELFVAKPKGIIKPIAIQKDWDKTNNAANNLEWVSYSYFRHLLIQKRKENND